eukprot:112630-Amorphochlora_amoeboformis.AAC.2
MDTDGSMDTGWDVLWGRSTCSTAMESNMGAVPNVGAKGPGLAELPVPVPVRVLDSAPIPGGRCCLDTLGLGRGNPRPS